MRWGFAGILILLLAHVASADVIYDFVKIGNHGSDFSGQITLDIDEADLPTTVDYEAITEWSFEIDGDVISNPPIETLTNIFGGQVISNGVRMSRSFPLIATEDSLSLPSAWGSYISFVEPVIVNNELTVQAVNLFHSPTELYHYSLDDESFRFEHREPIDGDPVLLGTRQQSALGANLLHGCVSHGAVAVPEPSSIVLVLLGACAIFRKLRS